MEEREKHKPAERKEDIYTDATETAPPSPEREPWLAESKKLKEKGVLSGEVLADLARSVHAHSTDFKNILSEQETGISASERVLLTSRLMSVARGIEQIVESDKQQSPDIQEIENLRREAADVHAEEIARFVKDAQGDAVQAFIMDRLSHLESLMGEGNLSPELARSVGTELEDATLALAHDNLAGAASAVLEAEQRIATAQYVGT